MCGESECCSVCQADSVHPSQSFGNTPVCRGGSIGRSRHIVGVKKFDLVEHIPGALVARGGGEETASPPGSQEGLNHLITLRIRMPEIVAFVDEHKIAVAVL